MTTESEGTWQNVVSQDMLVALNLVRLFAYWNSLPRNGVAPDKKLVHPRDLKFMLGWICIHRVIASGADYEFALLGSEFTARMGVDLTGKSISQVAPSEFIHRTAAIFDEVVRTQAPVQNGPTSLHVEKQDHVVIESLSLPFTRDGHSVTDILVGIDLS